jgi:prepilin-type N-terminal cleavage/methylation domain-containing protein
MNDYFRKRGYTLVEMLLAIMIIAILAGSTLLVVSRNNGNAEAAVIMSDLDAAKNALLAYSMEHRTRTSDRMEDFIGKSPSVINGNLDKYMSSQVDMAGSKAKARFDTIRVDKITDANGLEKIRIGFVDFPADRSLIGALQRKTAANQNNAANYQVISMGGTCSIWLNVK